MEEDKTCCSLTKWYRVTNLLKSALSKTSPRQMNTLNQDSQQDSNSKPLLETDAQSKTLESLSARYQLPFLQLILQYLATVISQQIVHVMPFRILCTFWNYPATSPAMWNTVLSHLASSVKLNEKLKSERFEVLHRSLCIARFFMQGISTFL